MPQGLEKFKTFVSVKVEYFFRNCLSVVVSLEQRDGLLDAWLVMSLEQLLKIDNEQRLKWFDDVVSEECCQFV